ncbi:MAG: Gfo/Idh/MocA family oxidoreductase [Ignavibacteria bacterium]|nr:Gfo/Idh/MocA family oxidoreductase [Ignavibacteria bacterium]
MITSKSLLRNALPKKIKWGIAGCGIFAENSLLPAFQLLRRSKVVSSYSGDINRAKNLSAKFGIPNSFDDFDKFLESGIDAVYVASANANHYWQTIKAAESNINVLCERPIAITSIQGAEMINACKKNGVHLVVNHSHRFHPLVLKAKELLNLQILGKIFSITASSNIEVSPGQTFRFKKELSGGGVLIDVGSQVIDGLRFFGGNITDQKSFSDNIVHNSEVEDFSAAILKFEKGGYGQFNVFYSDKKAHSIIDIFGYNGSLSIESMMGKKGAITNLVINLPGEARKVFRKRGNRTLYMLKGVQKMFLKQQPDYTIAEDALESIKLIEQITASAK